PLDQPRDRRALAGFDHECMLAISAALRFEHEQVIAHEVREQLLSRFEIERRAQRGPLRGDHVFEIADRDCPPGETRDRCGAARALAGRSGPADGLRGALGDADPAAHEGGDANLKDSQATRGHAPDPSSPALWDPAALNARTP